MSRSTAGVDILLGNPRKGLLSVMWPILISVFVIQLVTYADSAWCSGLGIDAVSAISYLSTVYWMLAGLGMGLGIGVSTLVSRAIGEDKGTHAGTYITQSSVFMFITSCVMIVPLLLVTGPLVEFMGGGSIMDDCMEYAVPIIILCPFIILNGIVAGALRGEGDSLKTLWMNLLLAAVNIILDPVLIYILDLGLTGAALATGISSIASVALGLSWYHRNRTFVPITLKGFRFSRPVLKELLMVGGPQAAEYDLMYAFNIILFFFVSAVGGTQGLAVYNVSWRVVHLVVTPLEAIGSAVVPVASAAIGQRLLDKTRTVYTIATRFSLILGLILAVSVYLLSDLIVMPFTYSTDMAPYTAEITEAVHIYCTFVPFFGLIFVGAGIVQSMEKGYVSLVAAILRNVVLIAATAWASTVSMTAVYWSTSISEIIGGIGIMVAAYYFIRRLPALTDTVEAVK